MTKHTMVVALALAVLIGVGCKTAGIESEDRLPGSGKADDVTPSPEWKDRITLPEEPLAAPGGIGQPTWVKFTIVADALTEVFFQNSTTYPFHYDFAKRHLPGFASMSPEEYARVTLKASGQKLVTGTVLIPPRHETLEYGIQLIRQDAYTKEEVKRLFDLVKSKITISGGRVATGFYMPTYEQRPSAEHDRSWLAENKVPLGSSERWLRGDACYAGGWSFGTAKYFAGSAIKEAFLDGRLTPADVLVTDGTPAEVPYVAGIVTLSPSTPNSHVAILATTWGVPFVYPSSEATRARIRSLEGKEIVLRAITQPDFTGGESCLLEVIEPQEALDAATRADLAALRRPPPASVAPKTTLGALTRNTAVLHPSDVRHFGGKASNFGTLRRTIPDNSPNTLGISFDLWDAFLAQPMPSGRTLREEVDLRLTGLTFPPDVRMLETRLAELRQLVEDNARLPDGPRAKLFDELKAFGFDPRRKIRFRSSTNVEDGAVLSGAGLYDSYSGCLADDLDQDQSGPSACDAGAPKERGVERAIKKVYASFFNTNAVIERLKYRIAEPDVGMALAAHYSFPDENEAANGVATLALLSYMTTISFVTQLGAESVTNPTGGASPEIVTGNVYQDDVSLDVRQTSSLLPLGKTVMGWEADYRELSGLMVKVAEAFKADHGITSDVTLDIEYKRDTSGALILKQVRQVPSRSTVPSVVPVLLNEPVELCTHQGESGDVIANHRLKTRLTLESRQVTLSERAVAQPLVANMTSEMIENGVKVGRAGSPAALPGALHTVDGDMVRDSWTAPPGRLGLEVEVRRLMAPAEIPIVVPRDFRWMLTAEYPQPKDGIGYEGLTKVASEIVLLEPCLGAADVDPTVQTVTVTGPRSLQVTARFHYRKAQNAFEKTASLASWDQTEITGLVSQPIVLQGWYSQTFRPGHHNFSEDFAFEPGLEDGLSAAIRQELEQRDIQLLVVLNAGRFSPDAATFYVLRKSTQKLEKL